MKSDFTEIGGFFEIAAKGIIISISDQEMSNELAELAKRILNEYPQKVAGIAEYIAKDEWIATTYALSKEEIAKKLGPVNILLHGSGGRLSYCENRIDDDHILDVEFSGVLEEFFDISMDG